MTIRFKRRMTWHHDHLPKVVHTPDIGDKHTLDFQNVRKRYSKRVRKKKKNLAPSISTFRPIVFFHCLPARAIRRNRLSPSLILRRAGRASGESDCDVDRRTEEFTALSMEGDGPEKKAWIL